MRRGTIPDSIGDLTALEYVLWLVMLPAHHGRCFELFTASQRTVSTLTLRAVRGARA
jgi:hypothetical protein